MAWDTEATRRKLLDAGARQFAALGCAGARMEAIGRDASVNKERVYRYFGNKQEFFAAVLSRELVTLLDGLTVSDSGPHGVADFAGRMFDRFHDRPTLPRLLAWESLELEQAVAIERRRPMCATTADSLRTALPGMSRHDAEQLLFTIISLTVTWGLLPRVSDAVLTQPAPYAERREAIVSQAAALCRAYRARQV